MKGLRIALALAAAAALPMPPAVASTTPSGESWEMQLEMRSASHGNVAMPPQRICQKPAGSREDPRTWMGPQAATGCRAPQVQRGADRMSWRMQCSDGEGSGEVRFLGADRMEGLMRMKNTQGEFELQIRGRKVGTCELTEAGS